jgi:hypothetical protein
LIDCNYIKKGHLKCDLGNVPNSSRNHVVHNEEDGVNIGDQVSPMEEDNIDNGTIENDGINRLIQDTFCPMDGNFDDIHDVPMIEKSQQPLYEGSRTNLLSSILLFVNLKVLNGFLNTCLTQILRYVIQFITYT